jgi:hypothetical protein
VNNQVKPALSRKAAAMAASAIGALALVTSVFAGTDLHTGDVAVVGAANASPGLQIARGGSANVTINVIANDGNIASAQAAQAYVTLVTKYDISNAGVFSADNATTSTQSFNTEQNFSQTAQTLAFTAQVNVGASAACGTYSVAVVIAATGNQVNFASGFTVPTIYVEVINCSTVYDICVLYDQSKAHKLGSTIPVRLQLCDGTTNVSSASIVVNATGLVLVSDSTPADAEDSGNANPDNDFRYSADLGGDGGYIFNLSTKGLGSGTWKLNFTVDGQSHASYAVYFAIK